MSRKKDPLWSNPKNTTTVVIKGQEISQESVAEERGVDNGCDAPRKRFLLRNSDQASRSSGTVKPASSPSTGLFFLLLSDAGKPGMSHHRQGDVHVIWNSALHFYSK